MEKFFEAQLDQNNTRIVEIEKNIAVMHDNVLTLADQIKEMQLFLLKLAKNQAEITKRVSQWPYVAIKNREEGEDE